ncbi:uncharacterized protein LOC141649965 [Silene latifolia]|uniref:uncharacterized protein LOC141649965 n=1 Tax=Silene latifolia TaxID=37657 RepID=UPI003D76BD65
MNLLSLNCRGLGNPDAVCGLKNLLRREEASVVFLCETKLSSGEMHRVWSRFDGYTGVAVDSVGRSGGLAFLWRDDVRCTLQSASMHHMDFDVEMREIKSRVTGFYGWPAVQDRHLSWDLLRLLASESAGPRLCVGNYNEVLFSSEMKGGERAQWQMNNFRDAVDECGLRDIPSEGYAFTFDNGQSGEDNKHIRIDRAMATGDWRLRDECGPRKKFSFEHVWVGEEGCEDTIRRAWERDEGDVLATIENCARDLLNWKGISIGKVVKELRAKRPRLKVLNEGDVSTRDVEERRRVIRDISKLLRHEELFWRQRSRAIWLKEGDKNTMFFHRKASQRKQRNHIHRLVDDAGRVVEKTEEVPGVAVEYFKQLFTTTRPTDFGDIMRGVEGRVTREMNEGLRAQYTGEEVVQALNQMNPLKALGPDGMNGLCFQTYWHIVGPSVVR